MSFSASESQTLLGPFPSEPVASRASIAGAEEGKGLSHPLSRCTGAHPKDPATYAAAGIGKLSPFRHPKEHTLYENTNDPNAKREAEKRPRGCWKGKRREIVTVDRCPWSCLATVLANISSQKGTVGAGSEISLRPGRGPSLEPWDEKAFHGGGRPGAL